MNRRTASVLIDVISLSIFIALLVVNGYILADYISTKEMRSEQNKWVFDALKFCEENKYRTISINNDTELIPCPCDGFTCAVCLRIYSTINNLSYSNYSIYELQDICKSAVIEEPSPLILDSLTLNFMAKALALTLIEVIVLIIIYIKVHNKIGSTLKANK